MATGRDPGNAAAYGPREEPELDPLGEEIARVWWRVGKRTMRGMPVEGTQRVGEKDVACSLDTYLLDLLQIEAAQRLLQPQIDNDELLEGLDLMFTTSATQRLAYELPEWVKERERDAEGEDWLARERARLGMTH